MCIITRPINVGEPDLVIGHEFEQLIFTDLDETKVLAALPAPLQGWDHDSLEAINAPNEAWNAFLVGKSGRCWIGSSEI